MSKIRIAVLCSGGGTHFQAIVNAQEAGIETSVFDNTDYPDRADSEDSILRVLRDREIGLILFAGFMTILSAKFTRAYEGRMINVHPALIPSFCGEGYYGLRVHEAVLARGVKVTGATVHYVTEICDGGPIIAQRAVEVKEGDTPETLQKRVMREAEWIILPEAVETVCKKLTGE